MSWNLQFKDFLCFTIDWLHSTESKNLVTENKPPEVVNGYLFLKWNFWVKGLNTVQSRNAFQRLPLSLSDAEEYGKDNKRVFLRFPYEGVLVSTYLPILIF